ncbi:MAG TPA: radical SAM protein [Verrucomicrobiales bacterium]|nr:radical SAM protein [Verrucomicrobiales bacterium]
MSSTPTTSTAIGFAPERFRELLKATTSRCPVCHAPCPAEVWKSAGRPAKVYLERTCPAHGKATACIASDARFYWVSKGSPENGCCGGTAGSCCSTAEGGPTATLGRNATAASPGTFETLSTCLALIEIVQSCNLSCPTCYADSPLGVGAKLQYVPLGDLKARIQGVIDRKGGIEILQLSGGEPTLHPEFFELLDWGQSHPKIDYLLINTNGVRIAHDEGFASRLAAAARRRKVQLYLQFDGVQEAGQAELRGADLRETRERALERARQMDLPVTLAMTVTPTTLPHLWEGIAFGLRHPEIQGITLQPMFRSGRHSSPEAPGGGATEGERLNTADLLIAAVTQSAGALRFEDFTPVPCGDPNCATIGYLLRLPGGEVRSVSDFINFSNLQGFLHDRLQYRIEDLARCGCDQEPLGALIKQFELTAGMTFRIMVKPFMDDWSWDQDRIDRCCTHVIRPDGALDSFCRYYAPR